MSCESCKISNCTLDPATCGKSRYFLRDVMTQPQTYEGPFCADLDRRGTLGPSLPGCTGTRGSRRPQKQRKQG